VDDTRDNHDEGSKPSKLKGYPLDVSQKFRQILNFHGPSDRLDHVGQCLFICIEQGPMDHYAIKIPCFWPSEYRHIKWRSYNKEKKIKHVEYRPTQPCEQARECNSDILERILENCYRCIGSWKMFIPYFGIVDLKFVQVND
jgi:hypothetical protein